jgi:hypothetical protein
MSAAWAGPQLVRWNSGVNDREANTTHADADCAQNAVGLRNVHARSMLGRQTPAARCVKKTRLALEMRSHDQLVRTHPDPRMHFRAVDRDDSVIVRIFRGSATLICGETPDPRVIQGFRRAMWIRRRSRSSNYLGVSLTSAFTEELVSD